MNFTGYKLVDEHTGEPKATGGTPTAHTEKNPHCFLLYVPCLQHTDTGAIGALEHVLRVGAMFVIPADRFNTNAYSKPTEDPASSSFYENDSRGIGVARKLTEVWPKALEKGTQVAEHCRCDHGCPNCIEPATSYEISNATIFPHVNVLSMCVASLVSHRENEFAERSVEPFLCVVPLQRNPRPMAHAIEQFLEGYEPFPKSKPDSASQAGLVRTAQHPSVAPPERMGPERFLAQVQRDVLHTQGQLGAFPVGHSMHGRQRRVQLVGRNRLFRAPPLESRLGLRHAVFDSLHAPAPSKRRPCTGPPSFDDRVRVHEHGSPAVEGSVQRSITCSTRWTANSSSRPSIGNPTSTAARRTDT